MLTLEPTESEVIAGLTDRTDIPDPKPGAIDRKRVLHPTPPVDGKGKEAAAPSAIKRKGEGKPAVKAASTPGEKQTVTKPARRRKRRRGKRRVAGAQTKRATLVETASVDADAQALRDEFKAVVATMPIGTYHGRGAPSEGLPILRAGKVGSNGRVRIVLADGRAVVCTPDKIRGVIAHPDGGDAPIRGSNGTTAKSVGRPSRLVLATRELTKLVLVAIKNGETDVVTVMIPYADALALIGHGSCEFCGTPVPSTVGVCDLCRALQARVEANPCAARKILRRVKAG